MEGGVNDDTAGDAATDDDDDDQNARPRRQEKSDNDDGGNNDVGNDDDDDASDDDDDGEHDADNDDDDASNGSDEQGPGRRWRTVQGAQAASKNGHGAKRGGAIGQPTAVKTDAYEQARLETTERAPSQSDGRMEKFEAYAIFTNLKL